MRVFIWNGLIVTGVAFRNASTLDSASTLPQSSAEKKVFKFLNDIENEMRELEYKNRIETNLQQQRFSGVVVITSVSHFKCALKVPSSILG